MLNTRLQKQLQKKQVSLPKGFTLMELMMVIAVAAIMMAVGAPSVVGMLNNNAQTSTINSLVSGVATTRTYAVTHKRPFVIEAIDGDWSKGYQIKSGTIAGESVAEIGLEENSDISVSSNVPGFISFDRLGRATPANASFEICNGNTDKAVIMDVNIFGKTQIHRTASDGIDYIDKAC